MDMERVPRPPSPPSPFGSAPRCFHSGRQPRGTRVLQRVVAARTPRQSVVAAAIDILLAGIRTVTGIVYGTGEFLVARTLPRLWGSPPLRCACPAEVLYPLLLGVDDPHRELPDFHRRIQCQAAANRGQRRHRQATRMRMRPAHARRTPRTRVLALRARARQRLIPTLTPAHSSGRRSEAALRSASNRGGCTPGNQAWGLRYCLTEGSTATRSNLPPAQSDRPNCMQVHASE